MPRLRPLLSLLAAIVALTGSVESSADGQSQAALLAGDDFTCEHPAYKVHMVSLSPLVLYITDFLTPNERSHFRKGTEGHPSNGRVPSE